MLPHTRRKETVKSDGAAVDSGGCPASFGACSAGGSGPTSLSAAESVPPGTSRVSVATSVSGKLLEAITPCECLAGCRYPLLAVLLLAYMCTLSATPHCMKEITEKH